MSPHGAPAPGRRHRPARCVTALPPRHRQADHDDDQADLQDQPEDRRQSAETAEQAAAEQHAEQARAEEAGREAAQHAAAGPVEEAAAAARQPGARLGKVRLNGCAAPGAVEVLGGAENVRAPRDPELRRRRPGRQPTKPPAINGVASDKTMAMAQTMPRARCINFMSVSSHPRQGKRP